MQLFAGEEKNSTVYILLGGGGGAGVVNLISNGIFLSTFKLEELMH